MPDAEKLISEIGRTPIGDGDLEGEPFRLYPAQKRFIRGAMGEKVLVASWSTARGGGKSGTASALALNTLIPDCELHRAGGESVLIASSFAQARITFDSVLRSLELMDLRDEYRVLDQQNLAVILHRETRARLRVAGCDNRRAHGWRVNLLIADEPAQWGPRGSALQSALLTSLGKRKGSRAIYIGTRPASDLHFYSKLLSADDASRYSQVHASPKDAGSFNWKAVQSANPGMKYGLPDPDVVKAELRLAKKDPSLMASFRSLRMNQGTSDVLQSSLLEAESWRGIERDELPGRCGRMVLGLDFGSGLAMSAAAAFWPDTGRLEVMAAFPSMPSLEDRASADGADPGLYREMADAGDLVCLGAKIVPVRGFLERAQSRFGTPAVSVLDRWRSAEVQDAAAQGFQLGALVFRGMGWKDGAEDVRLFRCAVVDGRVSVKPSLLMRSAISEARVSSDAAGNEKLAKLTEGGRRSFAKDDAVAAAILAIAEGERIRGKAKPRPPRIHIVEAA